MTVTEIKPKAVELESLKHIDFSINPEDASFSISFRPLEKYDALNHKQEYIEIANKLWEPINSLACCLTGFEPSDIQPSRWDVDKYGRQITRYYNSPKWKNYPWKDISGLVHLRDSYITSRSIDKNFIDLFLTMSSIPYEHSPIENDKNILELLKEKQETLEKNLTDISRITLEECDISVSTLPIIWEKECVPVWGDDGYWLKGIVQ